VGFESLISLKQLEKIPNAVEAYMSTGVGWGLKGFPPPPRSNFAGAADKNFKGYCDYNFWENGKIWVKNAKL
jgi:hypothetical protein